MKRKSNEARAQELVAVLITRTTWAQRGSPERAILRAFRAIRADQRRRDAHRAGGGEGGA